MIARIQSVGALWVATVFLVGCGTFFVSDPTPTEGIGLSAEYIGKMYDAIGEAKTVGLIDGDKRDELVAMLDVALNAAEDANETLESDLEADVSDNIGIMKATLSAVRSALVQVGAQVPQG